MYLTRFRRNWQKKIRSFRFRKWPPELPLKGNYEETKYKIYFADSGLLVAMLDDAAQDDLRMNKNLGVYKGALYENIVGEALVKCGYSFWNKICKQQYWIQ